MLPAIALLRFRHAQISFLFLGASSTYLSLSLSLSLASSFPPLPHKLDRIIKFAVVRGATFKLQETLVLSLLVAIVAMVKLLEL
jgi:hypothetical protein